jgi:hypothetical protein
VIIAEVEIRECAVFITSSPPFTLSAAMARCSAFVPLAQETQCFTSVEPILRPLVRKVG